MSLRNFLMESMLAVSDQNCGSGTSPCSKREEPRRGSSERRGEEEPRNCLLEASDSEPQDKAAVDPVKASKKDKKVADRKASTTTSAAAQTTSTAAANPEPVRATSQTKVQNKTKVNKATPQAKAKARAAKGKAKAQAKSKAKSKAKARQVSKKPAASPRIASREALLFDQEGEEEETHVAFADDAELQDEPAEGQPLKKKNVYSKAYHQAYKVTGDKEAARKAGQEAVSAM
jgi:hypothetical protein